MKTNHKYRIISDGGYYILENLDTGRRQNTGYDCGDYPRKSDGSLPDFIISKYRRALSLPSEK
jgi:hypothetical protein